jgi:hypothetical protein
VADAQQPPRDLAEEAAQEAAGGFCQQAPALRLALVFRSAAGQELVGPSFDRYNDTYGGLDTQLEATFDFDGDGVSEAIVVEVLDGEGFDNAKYSLKAVGNGAIVDYAPARGLTVAGIQDFDHDARPDLLYAVHQATTSDLGVAGTETSFLGLAHARPNGTFALNDDVTARFYLQACPVRPSAIVAEKDGTRDDVATGKNIVCARAWGSPESEVRTALDQACRLWSEELLSCDPQRCPASQPCPTWWKHWLALARQRISVTVANARGLQ